MSAARADLAGKSVDAEHRGTGAHVGGARHLVVEETRRFERHLDRHAHAVQPRERRLGVRLQMDRLIADIGADVEARGRGIERAGGGDAIDPHLETVSRIRHDDRAVLDGEPVDGKGRHCRGSTAAAAGLSRRSSSTTRPTRGFAGERDADDGPRHRQIGDRRPAGEKAHERERDPSAVGRDVEAGRRPDGIAHAELAQREDRCRPQRQRRTAVDAQAVAGADRLILRVLREESGGYTENSRKHHHRRQSCESESRNLAWLHAKSS